MLTELLNEIKNYFIQSVYNINKLSISGGQLPPLDFLQEGQYFRIIGSVFNDGVYQYPVFDLKDETFDGEIWALAVPPAVIALADEIKAYTESDFSKPAPYTSESFGGYSYTRAVDADGLPVSWQKQFRSRLNKWRKI